MRTHSVWEIVCVKCEQRSGNTVGCPHRGDGFSSNSARKEASARIAMIPFDLARWVGEYYFPLEIEVTE